MNNWFTSDWHLGHEKLILQGRGFSSIEEHDQYILDNVFSYTKPGDNLYLLGDIFWKYSSHAVAQLMGSFKKHKLRIFWIFGNHDKKSWVNFKVVQWAGQIKDITIDKQPLTLSHYPMLVYNRSHYGGINLFGHIHHGDNTRKAMDDNPKIEGILGKALNVNVEFHEYRPIEFEEVLEAVKDKPENFDLIKSGKKYEETLTI